MTHAKDNDITDPISHGIQYILLGSPLRES